MPDLKSLIRTIPDYPKAGIMFRDVTTLLGDAQGFKAAIHSMAEPYRLVPVDAVAGIEARGFIFGAALASRMRKAFVPVRKPGKLPSKTHGQLRPRIRQRHGRDAQRCAVARRAVLIVDDLIATGGTAGPRPSSCASSAPRSSARPSLSTCRSSAEQGG